MKLNYREEKYLTGQIHRRYTDFNGVYQGEYKSWYCNGTPFVVCNYDEGCLHGEYKAWYENGTTQMHAFYMSDEFFGERKVFSANGELVHHDFGANDEVIIDFLEHPHLYPKTEEERLAFMLKYGVAPFLPLE